MPAIPDADGKPVVGRIMQLTRTPGREMSDAADSMEAPGSGVEPRSILLYAFCVPAPTAGEEGAV